MKLIFPLVLQVVLIFLNAVFAMAEIAVISVTDAKLQKLSEQGNRKAKRLSRLKSRPAKFLATIQVAITLAGFMGSAFAADHFAPYAVKGLQTFLPLSEEALEGISVVLITLLLSYFSLIFGELVPKRVAMRKSEKIALGLSGTVYAVSKCFAPIVWLLTVSTNGVLRLMGIDPNSDEEEVSEEDIRMMAEMGAEQGKIEEDERELIENIFAFDDLSVGELSTHRTDVTLLWMEESEEEWERTIRESRFSIYPICDGSIDNVVGVLDSKDYFRLPARDRKTVLEKAVRTPYFVPEGAPADITFRNMKKKRESFAIVLDEYAGFKGVITIKDLIECIVGEILQGDEASQEEELQQVDRYTWRVNGNVSLAVMGKALDLEFPDEYDTFSGLVLSLYGSIPDDGATFTVEWEGITVSVSDVKEHQVCRATVTLPERKRDEDEDEE